MSKVGERRAVSLILRVGLAFVFIYVGIASFINPQNWIGFLPDIGTRETLLVVFSIYELILGIWLLSNRKIFYASILSVVTLSAIIIFNLGAFDIVFRDIAILAMAIALAFISKEK